MKTIRKIELELNSSHNWNMACFFGSGYMKQELHSNDYLKLFGELALVCRYNSDILEDYSINMADVIDSACIQDNELYLNNFEGYQLSERLNLRTLYINEFDNIVFSVYDNKKDRLMDFVA